MSIVNIMLTYFVLESRIFSDVSNFLAGSPLRG